MQITIIWVRSDKQWYGIMLHHLVLKSVIVLLSTGMNSLGQHDVGERTGRGLHRIEPHHDLANNSLLGKEDLRFS